MGRVPPNKVWLMDTWWLPDGYLAEGQTYDNQVS